MVNFQDSHIIPGLMHKAYLAAKKAQDEGLNSGKLIVCGTGTPMRQFIYSRDLARLIIWVLENYTEQEPIILSVDEKDGISIGQAAQLVADGFEDKIKLELEDDKSYSDGQFKKTASNLKLQKYVPDFKFTPIAEGIKQTVDWFYDNYDSVRK